MLILSIDETSAAPVYRQIVDAVRGEIASGRLRPGERLPSVRELARDLGVNVNTVHKAYQILQQLKIVLARPARGVIVAPTVTEILGSEANEAALRGHVGELLAEASRLGFSAKDVARLVLKHKR